MQKHTPGPWTQTMGLVSDTLGYCTDEAGHIAIVGDPAVHGATFGGSEHPMSLHGTEEMARANAHLIAAAPDLLEALEVLLRQYRVARPQIFGTDTYEEWARAALAKARA